MSLSYYLNLDGIPGGARAGHDSPQWSHLCSFYARTALLTSCAYHTLDNGHNIGHCFSNNRGGKPIVIYCPTQKVVKHMY